jgi:hypothetical protein
MAFFRVLIDPQLEKLKTLSIAYQFERIYFSKTEVLD